MDKVSKSDLRVGLSLVPSSTALMGRVFRFQFFRSLPWLAILWILFMVGQGRASCVAGSLDRRSTTKATVDLIRVFAGKVDHYVGKRTCSDSLEFYSRPRQISPCPPLLIESLCRSLVGIRFARSFFASGLLRVRAQLGATVGISSTGTSFEQAFPQLLRACSDLFFLLLPWAFCLLVLAFAFEFFGHPPSTPGNLIAFLVKVFLIVLLLSKSGDLINSGQVVVQELVEQNIPARPERVAARYQEKLAEAQNAPSLKDQSFWDTLLSSNWFEAIIYAVLTLISWLAMAVLFFVVSVQRATLLFCWALCPLLLPTIAIRPFSSLGIQHVLRIIGIILWPIGLALAATFTDGLIDAATSQDFLASHSTLGSLGYGLQNLLAVTTVAVWIIFSSILAPVYISRLVSGGSGPGSVLTSSAGLITNIALPSYFGFPQAAQRVYRSGQVLIESISRIRQRSRRTPPDPLLIDPYLRIVPPKVKDSVHGPVETSWKPGPEDPSGDKLARSLVNSSKQNG